MAPPALTLLTGDALQNFSDTQFRDVYHRTSHLIAPSANVIQKLYTHVAPDGNTVLSGAEALTTDENNNAQYSILLGANANPLSASTIDAGTLTGAVLTMNASTTTVQSNVFSANLITCNSISIGSDVNFSNINATSLTVSGNVSIDTNTLRVDSTQNRVGIVNTDPAYPLDVTGDVNTTGNIFVNGAQVLSGSALGSGVTSSSLTSVGTLGSLAVSANAAVGNLVVSGNNLSVGSGNGLIRLGNRQIRSYLRNLGTTQGSAVEVCSLTSANASFFVEVVTIQNDGGDNSISKYYTFPMNNISYVAIENAANHRVRVNPSYMLDYSGIPDFHLEIEVVSPVTTTYQAKLRLVRRRNSSLPASPNIDVTVTVYSSRNQPVTIETLSGTASGQDTSITQYAGSAITLNGLSGFVGINTLTPGYNLDLDGNFRATSNIHATGSGGFVGTLYTPNQSHITEVGTLGALSVTGTATVGNVSAASGNVSALNLFGTIQTPSQPQITSVGTLGALSVSGSVDFDGISTRRFLKALGGTVGDTANICEVDAYYGVFAAELVIISDVSTDSSGRFSKTYHVNVRDNATGGAYQLLLPSMADTHDQVALEMLTTSGINSTTTFRLHRVTSLSGGSIIECHVKVYYSTRETDVDITDSPSTTSGETLATTIYETSSITNVNGNVGIGITNPTSKLMVAGTANVTAIVSTDVKTGNATFFTQSGYGTLNFSDKWRLHYNQADDQLEIQKNTAGTWSTTAVLAS